MNEIQKQLTQLRLHGMSSSWQSLLETKTNVELSLSQGLSILLQAEKQSRQNRRFQRLTTKAKFRYQASIEEIVADASRGLGKELLATLATGQYIENGQAILITGATGCGKSFIASALGHQGCALGHKVAYYNLQKLFVKTRMARLDGTIHKFMEGVFKTDLLILDDFGLSTIEPQYQLDLMEIMEDRHNRAATIIASQLPVAKWFDIIGEATIADAILDRLVHTSYRVELKGESRRKKNQ